MIIGANSPITACLVIIRLLPCGTSELNELAGLVDEVP